MSSSESGQEKPANTIGNLNFGRWRMKSSTEKEDIWYKPVVGVVDSHIRLRRVILNFQKREFEYHVYFAGDAHILRDPFKGFAPGYEDHDSVLNLGESWEAQAFIDRFLERVKKLKAFL